MFALSRLTRGPDFPTRAQLARAMPRQTARRSSDLRRYQVLALWKAATAAEFGKGACRSGRESNFGAPDPFNPLRPVITGHGKRLPARLLLGAFLLLAAFAAAVGAARADAARRRRADRPLRRARRPRAGGLQGRAGRARLADLRAARPPRRLPRRALDGTALPGRADPRQAAGDRRRPAPRRAPGRARR